MLCATIVIGAAFIAMSFYKFGYDDAAAKCKPPAATFDINKMTLKSQARWAKYWSRQHQK